MFDEVLVLKEMWVEKREDWHGDEDLSTWCSSIQDVAAVNDGFYCGENSFSLSIVTVSVRMCFVFFITFLCSFPQSKFTRSVLKAPLTVFDSAPKMTTKLMYQVPHRSQNFPQVVDS